MHLLVGQDVRFSHQLFINGDTTFVVDIGIGNTGAMDFTLEHYAH